MDPKLARVIGWLQRNLAGDVDMDESTIAAVAEDVKEALRKQFASERRKDETFRVSPSNAGKPLCQLQMEKSGADAVGTDYNFLMRMVLGDIVEAVLKGVIKEAGLKGYTGTERVTAEVGDGQTISGELDLCFDDQPDDIKSTSDWAFRNKFTSWSMMKESDSFGYVQQLHIYARGKKQLPGGIWAVNIATGQINRIECDDTPEEHDRVISNVAETIRVLGDSSVPFERCFTDEAETFYKTETGNRKLGKECSWCRFRFSCWPGLQERESVWSKAKNKPMVAYTQLTNFPEEEEAYV